VASRDDVRVAVSILRRGVDAANLGIADADRSIVLVTARRNDRCPHIRTAQLRVSLHDAAAMSVPAPGRHGRQEVEDSSCESSGRSS
jgi:hypothetical protein